MDRVVTRVVLGMGGRKDRGGTKGGSTRLAGGT